MSILEGLSAEAYRLAALHELAALDTEEAPALEPLCLCAARLCGAAVAWIALVDASRHWLKASWGWSGAPARPRGNTPCDTVVRTAQCLSIEDLSAHPDWSDTPITNHSSASAGPPLRAYSGVPLRLPDGQVVGTLAVLDPRSSEHGTAQLAGLGQLAALAVEILIDQSKHSLDQALMPEQEPQPACLLLQAQPSRVFHVSVGARQGLLAAGYRLNGTDCPEPGTWEAIPGWRDVRYQQVPQGEAPITVVRAEVEPVPADDETVPQDAQTDRAAEFLRYANQVLLAEGYGNFSVRKVAKAADVGVGHLQHYFATKQELLEAMIEALSRTLWQHYAAHIAPVKHPLDRLLACAAFVLDDGKRYDRARLLREYTVMSQHEPKVAMALAAYFSRSRVTVTELLRELHPTLSESLAAARAAEIVSLLSSAFLFTQSVDASGRLPGYDAYLKARMVELAYFPPFQPVPQTLQ